MNDTSKFMIGPMHIHNPTPKDEEEAHLYADALAKSGNYPAGLDECFSVGISGGCGHNCFVYRKGDCETGEELAEDDDGESIKLLYSKR